MSRSRYTGHTSTATSTTPTRDSKQQAANNRKEKWEPFIGWQSCNFAWEECDIIAWDKTRQEDSEIKTDLAKRAFKEATYDWSDFVCSLGCRCPEIPDIHAFVENSLSEKLKPRVRRKSQTHRTTDVPVENGSKDEIPVQSSVSQNDTVSKGAFKKTDVAPNKRAQTLSGANRIQETKSNGKHTTEVKKPQQTAAKRTSACVTMARERPAARALLRRRSISLGNIQLHDDSHQTVSVTETEKLPISTDERSCTPDEARTRSSSRASVIQLREIADKIIFEDGDFINDQSSAVGVGHVRRDNVSRRHTPVKFHYTRSNISLNSPTVVAAGSGRTGRPHSRVKAKEKACFVTSLRKFNSEPNIESATYDTKASRFQDAREMAVVSVTSLRDTNDVIAQCPHTGAKDVTNTSNVLKTAKQKECTKEQTEVPTDETISKGSQKSSGRTEGDGSGESCAEPSSIAVDVNRGDRETPEGDFASAYFRDRSASTFFPIADLLPAVDHSIKASYAQNRVRGNGVDTESITGGNDSYVTWTDRELASQSKESLLSYEERLIMIREGVDLDRLKERNQPFLGPPAFRPHQNRTPLHRARESTAKRLHGTLHLFNGQGSGDQDDSSRSRWKSANGQMYSVHRNATGSISARTSNESAERAKRHDIISRKSLSAGPKTFPSAPKEGRVSKNSAKPSPAPSAVGKTVLLMANGDMAHRKSARSKSAYSTIAKLSQKNREASFPASTRNGNDVKKRNTSAGRLFAPYKQSLAYSKVKDILKI